jgi:hypothetical protein
MESIGMKIRRTNNGGCSVIGCRAQAVIHVVPAGDIGLCPLHWQAAAEYACPTCGGDTSVEDWREDRPCGNCRKISVDNRKADN